MKIKTLFHLRWLFLNYFELYFNIKEMCLTRKLIFLENLKKRESIMSTETIDSSYSNNVQQTGKLVLQYIFNYRN